MLSKEKQTFIERYQNENGDVYKVLDSMGLENFHLMSWRSDPDFEKIYKDAQRKIISFLNSENYITGLRRLNQILDSGVSEEIVQTKQRVVNRPKLKRTDDDFDDEPVTEVFNEYEVTRKVVKKGIPPQMISIALQQNSLVQAINTLTSQGILPDTIARKILAKSDEISREMQSAFSQEKSEQEMSQAKAIELLKIAVLKGVQE